LYQSRYLEPMVYFHGFGYDHAIETIIRWFNG
jgi:hypothetical protein